MSLLGAFKDRGLLPPPPKAKTMKPTRFQKELQKEIDRLESVVLTEQLKESLARERKEGAQKQIETLKEQLNVGAYASL